MWDKLQHKMFWKTFILPYSILQSMINFNIRCFEIHLPDGSFSPSIDDKLQHKMFWNQQPWVRDRQCRQDKLQHKMFWNKASNIICRIERLINFNIRCFEILCHLCWTYCRFSDKLQHKMFWNYLFLSAPVHPLSRINFNIRCFEM